MDVARYPAGKILSELLEKYSQGDPVNLRRYQKKLADKRVAYEEKRRNHALADQYADDFFEERNRIREMASKALDRAIESGDDEMAAIAVKFIEINDAEDFFTNVNRLCERGM